MTAERAAELKAMYDDPNLVVDTSDIPEWTAEGLKNAVRGRSYRPLKKQVTARLDRDAIEWLEISKYG